MSAIERWSAQPVARGAVRPLQAEVHPGGQGPAVVLLHGQPGTCLDWQWVVPLLRPDFTVVVPDRPGYGATGGPATGFAGNADAVAALLERLGYESAVVVGHSWAGGAALATAISYPDRVAGLVLVSSVGPEEQMSWEDRLLALPVAGEVMAGAALGGAGLLLGSRRIQDLALRRLPARARDGVASLSRLTRSSSRVWRTFVAEQRAMLSELEALRPGLATINTPTVIVHGGADHVVPAEVAEQLHSAIPGSRRRVIDGTGHLLPHDRPDSVAAAVREVTAGWSAG